MLLVDTSLPVAVILRSGTLNRGRSVEEVVYSHPAVFEAAVIGVPDEQWSESVRAVVVLKERQLATAEDMVVL